MGFLWVGDTFGLQLAENQIELLLQSKEISHKNCVSGSLWKKQMMR